MHRTTLEVAATMENGARMHVNKITQHLHALLNALRLIESYWVRQATGSQD
jgi:hypothetical protein